MIFQSFDLVGYAHYSTKFFNEILGKTASMDIEYGSPLSKNHIKEKIEL